MKSALHNCLKCTSFVYTVHDEPSGNSRFDARRDIKFLILPTRRIVLI